MILSDHISFYNQLAHVLPYIGLAMVGAIAAILIKLANLEKLIENFSLEIWWQKNRFSSLLVIFFIPIAIITEYSLDSLTMLGSIKTGLGIDLIIRTFTSLKKTGK